VPVSEVLGLSGVRAMSPKNWGIRTDLCVESNSYISGEGFCVHYCFNCFTCSVVSINIVTC
jgi:hypothetical protein